MFGKKYANDLISRSAESTADRPRFPRSASAAGLGLVGAGPLRWMATPALAAQAGNANAISDSTILNFALNLENLEAEFYSYAVNGEELPENLTHGTGQRGPATGGHAVQSAARQSGSSPRRSPAMSTSMWSSSAWRLTTRQRSGPCCTSTAAPTTPTRSPAPATASTGAPAWTRASPSTGSQHRS
jgi:hypothetical protein